MKLKTTIILLSICLISLLTILVIISNIITFDLYTISKDLRKNTNNNWTCQEYTNYYTKEFDKLGIEYIRILIGVSNESINDTIHLKAHTFLLVMNEEGYCKLDRRNLDCIEYF